MCYLLSLPQIYSLPSQFWDTFDKSKWKPIFNPVLGTQFLKKDFFYYVANVKENLVRVWKSACSITVTVLSPPEGRKQTGGEEGFISALTFKSTTVGKAIWFELSGGGKSEVKLQRLTMTEY